MKSNEYIENVLKTESIDFESISARLSDPTAQRLLHGAFGVVTESGELADMLKKHIFYNKDLDLVNLEEELGDLCWYMSIIIFALRELNVDVTWEDIWHKNIEKLKARYGEKFTEERANNRDLETERNILER